MALSLSYAVTETINLSSPGIGAAGFGIPLIYSNTGNAWATPELTRTYNISAGLTGFAADFPSGTVEYLIASAMAAQPMPPTTIMVGKGTHTPTLVRTVTVSTATSGAVYLINVWNGGALWTATYTATGGDTTTTIATALVGQLTPSAWQALHVYTIGQRVTNDSGKVYQATSATGTSAGAGGPTGTGASITDGTVTWEYISTPNFTAANGGTNVVTCTGSAQGNWFALEPIASGDPAAVSNLMALVDTTTLPAGLTTDLDNILSASSAWYALLPVFKSSAILTTASTGISAWCATNKRLLVAAISDTACATTTYSAGATDALAVLTQAGSSYTAGQWHPRDYEALDACTVGYFLPITPGGDNWRMKTLTGPTPVNLTSTQQTNLDGRRAGYYTTLGSSSTGQNVLAGGGYVESTTYGFIDTRRNIDSHVINEQTDLVNLLIQNNKLPNTTAGRRQIVNAMRNRIQASIRAGIISPDALDPNNAQSPVTDPYVITMPAVSDTTTFNSATRALSGISEKWKLAGAINSLSVTVNVTQ